MENILKLAPLALLILGVILVVWCGLSKNDVPERNAESHGTGDTGD